MLALSDAQVATAISLSVSAMLVLIFPSRRMSFPSALVVMTMSSAALGWTQERREDRTDGSVKFARQTCQLFVSCTTRYAQAIGRVLVRSAKCVVWAHHCGFSCELRSSFFEECGAMRSLR